MVLEPSHRAIGETVKDSVYVAACGVCGQNITSTKPTGQCPNCGVHYEFHWQYKSGNELPPTK